MTEYVKGGICKLLNAGDHVQNSKLSTIFSKPVATKKATQVTSKRKEEEIETAVVKLNRPRRDRQVKKQRDVEKEKRTVFVGNVPKSANKNDLKKLFRKCGQIESIRFRNVVPEKKKTLKKVAAIKGEIGNISNSLNAYIVFKDENSVPLALKLNSINLSSHQIRVDTSSIKQHDNSRSVFIGSLPFCITNDKLRNIFKDCGTIENVRIVRDRQTGIGKGFGYVLFSDRASVELALKLDGTLCQGRNIRVMIAFKKKKQFKENTKKDFSGYKATNVQKNVKTKK